MCCHCGLEPQSSQLDSRFQGREMINKCTLIVELNEKNPQVVFFIQPGSGFPLSRERQTPTDDKSYKNNNKTIDSVKSSSTLIELPGYTFIVGSFF